jgi:hypothetical protein
MIQLLLQTSAAKRTATVAVLLAALTVGGLAMAKNDPVLPAPTLSATPAAVTNQTSAAFTYTDSQSGASFQCSLDGASFTGCGTTRPSSISYPGPLSNGAHTFAVRAVSGAQTSAATSYSWTIDRTAPGVVSIIRADPTPSNAASVRWTVRFTEPVTGVDATDFQLVKTGLGGSPTITAVSGSTDTYTVSASTGSGTGTLGLNLVDHDSIKDAASNPLDSGVGNANVAGPAYSVDLVAPPAPTLTQKPSDPSPSATVTFAFTDGDANATFSCSVEGGAWSSCASPKTFSVDTSNSGQHNFAVRASDAAGNTSATTSYKWKVDEGTNKAFVISGAAGTFVPGRAQALNLMLTNDNNFAIQVTDIQVTVLQATARAGNPNPGCDGRVNLVQSRAFQGPVTVPANTTASLQTLGLAQARWPEMRMPNLTTNQDACKSTTFSLNYSGTATK